MDTILVLAILYYTYIVRLELFYVLLILLLQIKGCLQNSFSIGKQWMKDALAVGCIHLMRKEKTLISRRSAIRSLAAGKVYMPSFLLVREVSALDTDGDDGEREEFSTISSFRSPHKNLIEKKEVISLH